MIASQELDLAVRDVEDRLQFWRRTRDQALFKSSLQAWCEVLDWPSEVADHALSLNREHAEHLGRVVFKLESAVRDRKKSASKVARGVDLAKQAGALFNDGLRVDTADYTDASDEAMSKMEARDYLLIALAVAAAGYVAYRLARRPSPPVGAAPPRRAVAPTRWVLMLVINAGRDSVIDAVRNGGVAALDGDQLYQATQALWFGDETNFKRLRLDKWFSEERAVAEPTEYDVHLIRVDCASDDSGLHRNANQMDRLDAFRRFQSMGFKATVSPRLPSDAYGTTDVYSR